jgi:hypothetical protein
VDALTRPPLGSRKRSPHFTSIDARIEIGRMRIELADLAANRHDRPGGLKHAEAAEAMLRDVDAPVQLAHAQRLLRELRHPA